MIILALLLMFVKFIWDLRIVYALQELRIRGIMKVCVGLYSMILLVILLEFLIKPIISTPASRTWFVMSAVIAWSILRMCHQQVILMRPVVCMGL
jgi:hypothetical protein